jgi:hypothetical protein
MPMPDSLINEGIMTQEEPGNARHSGGPFSGSRLDYKSFCRLHRLADHKPDSCAGLPCFANRMAIFFPEVAVNIDEDDFGVLHLEVGAMKLATRDAIVAGNWYTVRRHFNFIADLFGNADPELRDAINVSYLGNLLYSETGRNYANARAMLPEPLSLALENVERHYAIMAA